MTYRFAAPSRAIRVLALGAIAASVLSPAVHLAFVALNLVASACVLTLQALFTRLPRRKPATRASKKLPFVSIQVPAHDEPPDVLIETLRSLAAIDWPHFEVLVIDNNTRDPARWRPVERACGELGPRFRFLHVEGLAGAKAGALNWARPKIDPRAEYVFVVDADYQVRADCLRRAFAHVTDERVALVQFPQDYRNVTSANAGLALELRHFFASYMHAANRLECVPSTGTLSFIHLGALRDAGGFDTQVITEDVELGLRMLRRGHRAVFVDEPVGTGLLPLDLEGVKKQRWRWAFGNAQVLRASWRTFFFERTLTRKQKLGLLAHMTAWFNFNLLPSVSLIALSLLSAMQPLVPAQRIAIWASGATLVSFLLLRFITLSVGLRRDGHRWREVFLAFVVHLGLGWIFQSSWLACLWDQRSRFVRTNKFVDRAVPGELRWMVTELAIGLCFVVACVAMVVADVFGGALAAIVFAILRLGIVYVWRQARATYEHTAQQVESQFAVPPDDVAA